MHGQKNIKLFFTNNKNSLNHFV